MDISFREKDQKLGKPKNVCPLEFVPLKNLTLFLANVPILYTVKTEALTQVFSCEFCEIF